MLKKSLPIRLAGPVSAIFKHVRNLHTETREITHLKTVRQISAHVKFQINQPDATVSQIYYLTFMCPSTCFGRLHAHHQELTTALTASGFTLERGGSNVVGLGYITGQTTTNNAATTTFQRKTRGC
jgi:hypothetical protein